MKKIHNISISQRNICDIYDRIRRLAEFCDVKCNIDYQDMSFGFPWNTCHYKLFIDGEEKNIKMFISEL